MHGGRWEPYVHHFSSERGQTLIRAADANREIDAGTLEKQVPASIFPQSPGKLERRCLSVMAGCDVGKKKTDAYASHFLRNEIKVEGKQYETIRVDAWDEKPDTNASTRKMELMHEAEKHGAVHHFSSESGAVCARLPAKSINSVFVRKPRGRPEQQIRPRSDAVAAEMQKEKSNP